MDIYFDAPNLLSFIRSAKKDKYGDCIRMLKDHFSLHFSFSKSDVESFCDDDMNDFSLWMRSMDNLKEDIKWGDKTFDVSFDLKQVEKDQNKLMSVYCLQNSQCYANKGMLLIASLGDEVDTLSTLFIESNQYTKNVFQKIKKWDDLLNYSSPTTDIILVDRFIFSNQELYSSNLYSILKVLCQKVNNQRVNIVIFTSKENGDVIDWDAIYTGIRNKVNGRYRPNVTFVTVNKEVLKEHDRSIFTNYKVFASGDSFNYFDSQGNKITKGRYLHVHSCADSSNADDAKVLVSDLQKIVSYIKEEIHNPNLIIKDKVSNFINF